MSDESATIQQPFENANQTESDTIRLILAPTDTRPHRYLRLPNRIEVVLVHDPQQDKSASALDVGVGYFEDPPELPGCAHLCEHMLLMGCERYPEEDGLRAYLSRNAGTANAYTSMCNTNVSGNADCSMLCLVFVRLTW